MPLTQERDTKYRTGTMVAIAVAAATKIFKGALVCINAAGDAVPGSVSTTLRAQGRAEETVDNLAGAAGDKSIIVHKGVFLYKNSSAGDLIAKADRGNDCYVVDDETVAKTNGGSTRSIAGKVHDVEAAGVWVRFS